MPQCDAYGNCDSNTYCNSYSYDDSETNAHGKAASNPCASAVIAGVMDF